MRWEREKSQLRGRGGVAKCSGLSSQGLLKHMVEGASTLSSEGKEGMGLLIHQFSSPFGICLQGGEFPPHWGLAVLMAESSSVALQKTLRERTERNWHTLECGRPTAASKSAGQGWATGTKSICEGTSISLPAVSASFQGPWLIT